MPIKLPPFLHRVQKPHQNLPLNPSAKVKGLKQQSSFIDGTFAHISDDFNLARNPLAESSRQRLHSDSPNKAYRKYILVLLLCFSLLLGVDHVFELVLTSRARELTEIASSVRLKEHIETSAKDLEYATEVYRRMLEKKDSLTVLLSSVLVPLEGMEVHSVSVDATTFSLSVEGPSSYAVSQALTKYVNDEHISHVVINAANLDADTQHITVSLGGGFQ
jgi:hypothetical protein